MVTSGRPPLRRGVLSWDLQLVALISRKPLVEEVVGEGVCKDAAGCGWPESAYEGAQPERALMWAGTTTLWVRGSLPPAQHQ